MAICVATCWSSWINVLVRKSIFAAAGKIESAESAALCDKWNAADGLYALGPERADNFIGEAIDLGATGEERLRGGKANT